MLFRTGDSMFLRNVGILFPSSLLKSCVDLKVQTNVFEELTVFIFCVETVCVIGTYQLVYTGL
jgi:hypothetical protein